MASLRGKDRVIARLMRIPPAMRQAAQTALDQEASDLVTALKAACPVGSDLERTPGELRDSIHADDGHRKLRSGGTRTTLLKTVIVDATDEHGNFIGPHVEFGHMAKDGRRVPAVPFFFTTWRVRKRAMMSRLAAAQRRAIKAAFGA